METQKVGIADKPFIMRCASLKNEVYKVLTNSEDDWDIDLFRATHKPTGIQYWIANGRPFFINEGIVSAGIGFWNWLKLWNWIQNAKRKKIIKLSQHRRFSALFSAGLWKRNYQLKNKLQWKTKN